MLIVVGDQDVATVPDKARRINERIRGSRLVIIPGAGDTSSVEEPSTVPSPLLEGRADRRQGDGVRVRAVHLQAAGDAGGCAARSVGDHLI
jgi:hypothetical protein